MNSAVQTSSVREEEPSASLKDLPSDALKHCFSFIPGSYVTVGPVSKQFYSNYSTLGIHESASFNSADTLIEIGNNRRTTADAVSNDIKLTEYCFINGAPKDFMIKVCQSAAMKGRVDILECANTFGIRYSEMTGEYYTVMKKLAQEGNLDMIQYFDDKLPEILGVWVWDKMFFEAKEYGHLNIMKWMHQEKHHLWDQAYHDGINASFNVFNNIEAYEYIHGKKNATPVATKELCGMAVEYGNIEVLEFCHQSNFPFEENKLYLLLSMTTRHTSKEKALETLKWLLGHGCNLNTYICYCAALRNNLEALKWARSQDCPWDFITLYYAAAYGHMDVLKYCLENECPMGSLTCAQAIYRNDQNKSIEVLTLLRERSCPWDEGTCREAIDKGCFEVLKWAIFNGCPWTIGQFAKLVIRGNVSSVEEALHDGLQFGQLFVQNTATVQMTPDFIRAINDEIFQTSDHQIIEKLKVLRKYGYQWDAETSVQTVLHDRLRVLQWLRFIECPMDRDLCRVAAEEGNIEILKYAHEVVGCELNKEAYAYCFSESGLVVSSSNFLKEKQVRKSHQKIYEYLKKNDCPKPKKSDWKIERFNATNNTNNCGI